MAQTKRKRTRKHRGTPAGTIERAGRTGRPQTREEAKKIARDRRTERLTSRPAGGARSTARPSPRVVFGVLAVLLFGSRRRRRAWCSRRVMFVFYIPLGYSTDTMIFRYRQRSAPRRNADMDVRMFTVGPVAENTYIFRRDGSDRALIVDPGDEADKLLGAIDALGVTLDGILLTHTHFDHVGAVAPVAKATGAEVWVPEIEKLVLDDIMSFVPWPGFGPFESYDAEHTLTGGEKLELAGFEIDVLFTPGHSPGHVTFSIPDEAAIFSGDVLFQGSVGRTDLPGGDWDTLLESIRGAGGRRCRRRPRCTPATWASRASAPSARAIRSSPSWRGEPAKLQAPRGTFDVQPADARRRLALQRSAAGAARRGRATSRSRRRCSRTPSCSPAGWGSRRTSSRRRCSPSRTRPGRSLTLRPEATAAICRAYVEHGMHKLRPAGEGLDLGPVLPPRGAAGGALSPVHAGGRRGARLRRPEPRRRADPAARRADRARRRRVRRDCACRAWARRETRAAYLEELTALPARARGRAVAARCASASTRTRCAPSTPTIPARRR